MVRRNVVLYSPRKRMIAEIDIVAIKDGCWDIYEVKCSWRISKAKRQLKKIRKILSGYLTVRRSAFFCGESGVLLDL